MKNGKRLEMECISSGIVLDVVQRMLLILLLLQRYTGTENLPWQWSLQCIEFNLFQFYSQR